MKPYVETRPKTAPADTIILGLVYAVRDQLYRDDQKTQFHPQLKDIKRALTWPATWLNNRGLYFTPERYQQVMLGIILDIKRHGATDQIAYWPRYLLKCIQTHFQVHAHEYVNECKAARDAVSALLAKLPTAPAAEPADHFTRQLAAAHALLRSPGGRKKKPAPAPVRQPAQTELF